MSAQGSGFGWSGTNPIGCIDNTTHELKTNHGFDYTYRVHFAPAGTVTRAGVTYVTALRGTYTGTLAVNAEGRTFSCLVNPGRTPTATESGVYTLRLKPLAAPITQLPPAPLGIAPQATAATGTMNGFHLPQTHRQSASAAAVASGTRSSVPGALVTPSEAIRTVGGRLPQDLLLVALLGLLIVFPAQLFNSTYEENHERIDARLARLRPRRRRPTLPAQTTALGAADAVAMASASAPPRGRRIGIFLACTVIGTLLGGLLDPKFGANTASYALMIGIFVSVLVAVLVVALAGRAFRSASHHAPDWYLQGIPSGLLIAGGCVIVSRLTHFEPGYLYGVLGGAVFAAALDRKAEGRAEVTAMLAGFVLALAAWVAFEPIARSASGSSPAFGVLTLDALLASVFIGGIEGLMFSLIPLRFLPGHRIKGWSWGVWGVLVAVVLYAFVHVLLNPASGYLGRSTQASVNTTIALFVAFALVSGLFWSYFRLRPTAEAPEAEPVAAAAGADPSIGIGAGGAVSAPGPAAMPTKVPVDVQGDPMPLAPPAVPRQSGPEQSS